MGVAPATVIGLLVEALGVPAEIVKVTRYEEIMKYPVLSTPGLVINEKLVCSGRIPNIEEITSWINEGLAIP